MSVKKIYQVVEDVSFESGGLRTAVQNLNHYINTQDQFESTILTGGKEKDDEHFEFAPTKFSMWYYSQNLKKYLVNNIANMDLLHVHGVFMYPQYISSKLAQLNDKPYVITAHGMLMPWYLNDKKLKKKVYLNLILNTMLAKSKILHTITPLETSHLFKQTGHKNIVEIPNFIHFSKLPANLSYCPNEEYLLYLSRLHPGKGLDILLQSMSKIDDKKIKLKIVGTENEYSEKLRTMSRELGIENRIEFLGSIYGDEKYRLFANAKAFIAPSYSEAIGIVNLEAAGCKTPVITTYNTGIKKEWNDNGGFLVNPNTSELIAAINQAVSWSRDERIQRGKMLSNFVENNYSWEKKGHLWNELYTSI